MLTNSKKIIFLILIVNYPNAAIAAGKQEETKQLNTASYFYVGANFGSIRYQHGCQDWAISCDKRDNAIGFYTGYQFNKYFAVEFGYADLGEVKASYDEYGNVNFYRATMEGFDLGVSTQYPLSNSFNVFAKVGALKWYGENEGPFRTLKSNEWSATVSAGVHYQLNESWRAKLSYQLIDDLGNTNLGSSNGHIAWLGISYTFGQKNLDSSQKEL